MARKRMIDPGIWVSEDFANLSMLARLIWVGLISNADDEGRGKANTAYLKSQLFPYDDELSLKKIETSLNEIAERMSITFYEVDGKKYYQLTKWAKFQTINRPTPSQIPTQDTESSNTNQAQLTEHSVNNHTQDTEHSLPKKEIEIEVESKDKYEKESVKEKAGQARNARTEKHKYGKFNNVLLTAEEYERLLTEPDGQSAIEYFSEYREMKGYKCKNDNLAIRNWAFDAVKERRQRANKEQQTSTNLQPTRQKVSDEEAKAWK